jgi:hypothetical protein
MMKINVSHNDIIKREPTLERYLYPDRLNYEQDIEDAIILVKQDVKNTGVDFKKVNVPLLIAEGENTGTSEFSEIDFSNREKVLYKVSDITGIVVFTLYNSNDETVQKLAVSENGFYSKVLTETSSKFKLSISGTCKYKVEAVEIGFDLLVIYKALEMIYRSLSNESGSNWETKASKYETYYNNSFNAIVYGYDKDGSGTIDKDEITANNTISYYR